MRPTRSPLRLQPAPELHAAARRRAVGGASPTRCGPCRRTTRRERRDADHSRPHRPPQPGPIGPVPVHPSSGRRLGATAPAGPRAPPPERRTARRSGRRRRVPARPAVGIRRARGLAAGVGRAGRWSRGGPHPALFPTVRPEPGPAAGRSWGRLVRTPAPGWRQPTPEGGGRWPGIPPRFEDGRRRLPPPAAPRACRSGGRARGGPSPARPLAPGPIRPRSGGRRGVSGPSSSAPRGWRGPWAPRLAATTGRRCRRRAHARRHPEREHVGTSARGKPQREKVGSAQGENRTTSG